MSGLGTILCHAKCLGAWTSFWEPCREPGRFLGAVNKAHALTLLTTPIDLRVDSVNRHDICSL
eukprot:4612023-Amphidinium_carterae.1